MDATIQARIQLDATILYSNCISIAVSICVQSDSRIQAKKQLDTEQLQATILYRSQYN